MKENVELAIFLATSGHSGVDRVMKNLVSELAGRGIRIDLLRIKGHGPQWERELLPENIRIIHLGASHVQTALPNLIKYLRKHSPRCLLTDKDRVNRMALLAKRLTNVNTRIVIRIGTTVSKNLERRDWLDRNMQLFSMRTLYKLAHAVIVPSRGAAEDLSKVASISMEKIRVVPSPVITKKLYKMAAEPISHRWFQKGGLPVILSAGELCARKDFETLIRAFSIVKDSYPSRLVILGEGRKRASLENLVKALGLQENVSMPGFVKNPYTYMARSSLFVLSSICEGAPVVLMEALSLGVPVVSTDCPSGPREILQGGKFGPLVPLGDYHALAEAMIKTLKAPLDAEILKSAAKPFQVEISADKYLDAMGLI